MNLKIGDISEEDFIEEITNFSEKELFNIIHSSMNNSKYFTDVQTNYSIHGIVIDIVAKDIHTKENIYVEIKSSKWLGMDFTSAVINLHYLIKKVDEKGKILFVTNKIIPNESRLILENFNIDIWDGRKLYYYFREEEIDLREIIQGDFNIKYVKTRKKTEKSNIEKKGKSLIKTLNNIRCGKNEWSKYQRLCSDILEFLFSPPLELSSYEAFDYTRSNRRDIILENPADQGFWYNIKNTYYADYIIIDAKNHCKPIGKKSVIEIGHYLKKHGCGLFGILLTRKGLSKPADMARRELWISDHKLIIILSDKDIINMIEYKMDNKSPEDIIYQLITKFRISF